MYRHLVLGDVGWSAVRICYGHGRQGTRDVPARLGGQRGAHAGAHLLPVIHARKGRATGGEAAKGVPQLRPKARDRPRHAWP